MKPTYKLEDFVNDPSFRAWVDGDPNAAVFWTDWLAQYPNQQPVINQARSMVRDLHASLSAIDELEVQRAINRLLRQARIARPAKVIGDEDIPFMPLRPWAINWARVAVSVLLFLSLGFGYYLLRQAEELRMAVLAQPIEREAPVMKEHTNTTRHPQTMVLSDGSVVTLTPRSKIRFADPFTGQFRVVYLAGGAFFEVTHNPGQPFLVYAGALVTQVVGTRFRVDASAADQTVRIGVKRGNAAVYNRVGFREDRYPLAGVGKAVLLLPNQEVLFTHTLEPGPKRAVEQRHTSAIASPED